MIHINLKFLNFLLLFAVFYGPQGAAHGALSGSPVTVPAAFKKIRLAAYADVLTDPTGRLTISDITTAPVQDRFVPNGKNTLTLGPPSLEVVWARFHLDTSEINHTASSSPGYFTLELGRPRYRVDFFQLAGARPQVLVHKCLSRENPVAQGDFNFRHLMFKIDPAGQDKITCYLRFQVYGPEIVPLVLRSEEGFRLYTAYDHLLFGMAYGTMLGMMIYNLFLFLVLRHREYLQYVLYIGTFFAYLFIFLGHCALFSRLDITTALPLEYSLLGACILSGFLFCRNFFNMKLMAPVWNILMYLIAVLGGLIFLTGTTGAYGLADILCNTAGGYSSVILTSIGILQWRRGFKPAILYISANVVFIMGTGTFILWGTGVLPSTVPGEQIFIMGPTFESLLLSFSLAYKIRLMERDRALLSESREKYRKASQMDGMTGLYNKQFLLNRLEKEIRTAHRTGEPLTLLIMDVDNFKHYNDTYGHPEGDVVLKTLANVITAQIRNFDYACRYGGEEFCVIFPDTHPQNAFRIAERIRTAIASKTFQPGSETGIRHHQHRREPLRDGR